MNVSIATGLSLACLSMAAAAVAVPVTVIDQIPASSDDFIGLALSDTGCDFGGPGLTSVARADDFRLDLTTGIDGVVFWGQYDPVTAPNDPVELVIRIHDDAGGIPGAVLAEPPAAISQELIELVQGGTSSLWAFTATFPPVELPPGTYWLEIVESDDTTDDCMLWPRSFDDPLHGSFGTATDQANAPGVSWSAELVPGAAGLVFRITGARASVVEVPSLGASGLVALGVALAFVGVAALRSVSAS